MPRGVYYTGHLLPNGGYSRRNHPSKSMLRLLLVNDAGS
jgi:hypothetical protein